MKKYTNRISKTWVVSIGLIIIFVGFCGCIQSTSTQGEKQSFITTPISTPIQTQTIPPSPAQLPDYYAYCRNTYPGTTYNPSTNQCEYPTIAPVITTTTTPIYTPVQTLGITNSCIFWITSNPIGASIYLDNQYEGITNSSYTEIFATRTTQHSLVLMKQGYANYTLIGTSCITGNIQLYSVPTPS